MNDPSNNVQTVDGKTLTIGQKGAVENATSTPVDAEQIKWCVRWFAQFEPVESPTINCSWIAAVISRWAGMTIEEGAVILAASRSGFPIGSETKRRPSTINIGVDKQAVNEFDCGCGPA